MIHVQFRKVVHAALVSNMVIKTLSEYSCLYTIFSNLVIFFRIPSNYFYTSSFREQWRIIKIGEYPLGFGECDVLFYSVLVHGVSLYFV